MTMLSVSNSPMKELITSNNFQLPTGRGSLLRPTKGKQLTTGLCLFGSLVSSVVTHTTTPYQLLVANTNVLVEEVKSVNDLSVNVDSTLNLEVYNNTNRLKYLFSDENVLIYPYLQYTEGRINTEKVMEDTKMRQTKPRVVKATVHNNGYVRHVFDAETLDDNYNDEGIELIHHVSARKRVIAKTVVKGYSPHVFKFDSEEEVSH